MKIEDYMLEERKYNCKYFKDIQFKAQAEEKTGYKFDKWQISDGTNTIYSSEKTLNYTCTSEDVVITPLFISTATPVPTQSIIPTPAPTPTATPKPTAAPTLKPTITPTTAPISTPTATPANGLLPLYQRDFENGNTLLAFYSCMENVAFVRCLSGLLKHPKKQ